MHVYLTNKPYRNLVTANFFNAIGSVLFNIVFIIYAGNLPYKTLAVTLISIADFVPTLFEIPSGYLADCTTQRLRLTIWLRSIQFGLYLLLAGLIAVSQALWAFIVLLLINVASDVISSYTGGLIMPYYKHFVARSVLNDAASFESGMHSTISIIFQGLGASLIVLLHQNYALFGIINAVSFLIAGGLLLLQRQTFAQADQQDTNVVRQARQNKMASEPFVTSTWHTMQLVHTDKPLFLIIMLILGINILLSAVHDLTNILLTTQKQLWLGSFGATIAIMSMASAVASAAGALFSHDGLQKLSMPVLISLATVMTALYGVNMFTLQNFYVMVSLSASESYLVGKISPRLSALVIGNIPQGRLAATSSLVSFLISIGIPVSQAVFLPLANLAAPALTWQIFTVCTVGGVVAGMYASRYLHRLTTPTAVVRG